MQAVRSRNIRFDLFYRRLRAQIYRMQSHPVVLLVMLMWIPCAFLLRNVFRHILKRRFPTWYEQKQRDAESIAVAGGFILSLFGVAALALLADLILPPN